MKFSVTLNYCIVSAASGQYCSGDLIFEDTFDIFDTRKWQHENTLSGGGVSKNKKKTHVKHLLNINNHFDSFKSC